MLPPDRLLDDAARARLITRFGPGVESWCAALPDLAGRCCQRWGLQLDAALSGNTSRVFIGRRRGDLGVVLKLTPDRSIANEEAVALRAWAATPHAVNLVDADLAAGALLLEKIEPGTKLSDQPQFPSASAAAAMLSGLRSAAGHPGERQLPSLGQRVEGLFGRIRGLLASPGVSPLVPPGVVTRGHELARELAGGGRTGLLHGDLHLSNMLQAGPARGLVAIDPRPCTGDLTFDAIDWAVDRAGSEAEIRDRIGQLCGLAPDLDRGRLWRWCQATAAAIAVLRLRTRPPDATTTLMLRLATQAASG